MRTHVLPDQGLGGDRRYFGACSSATIPAAIAPNGVFAKLRGARVTALAALSREGPKRLQVLHCHTVLRETRHPTHREVCRSGSDKPLLPTPSLVLLLYPGSLPFHPEQLPFMPGLWPWDLYGGKR